VQADPCADIGKVGVDTGLQLASHRADEGRLLISWRALRAKFQPGSGKDRWAEQQCTARRGVPAEGRTKSGQHTDRAIDESSSTK